MRNGLAFFSIVAAAALSFGLGSEYGMDLTPVGQERSLDVTKMHVIGQGCGETPEQKKRIYVALEEDDLPGPLCDIVFELAERDYK